MTFLLKYLDPCVTRFTSTNLIRGRLETIQSLHIVYDNYLKIILKLGIFHIISNSEDGRKEITFLYIIVSPFNKNKKSNYSSTIRSIRIVYGEGYANDSTCQK